VVIREDETLSSIKERVQKKLKVPDEDFSKVMASRVLLMFLCFSNKSLVYSGVIAFYLFQLILFISHIIRI
jgi:hypothetical protein